MNVARKMIPTGEVAPVLIPRHGWYVRGLPAGTPWRYRVRTLWLEICAHVRVAWLGLWRGLLKGTGVFGASRLYATVYRADGSLEHLGLISTKVVTDAGVAYIVDDWDGGANTIDNFNYHGCGTNSTAEAAGDTALGAETTTSLNPNDTRATGTKSQPAANQMRSVGTLTFDGTVAVVEHGIFTQAATGGGTLLDRSVFSTINVVSGDSVQFTYTLTLSAGG